MCILPNKNCWSFQLKILAITITIAIFFFISIHETFAVIISEVMPHTNNSWQDEWIELYNPSEEIINLTGWIIGDLSSNDTITNLIIHNKSFALIVDINTTNNTGCAAFNISDNSCFALLTIGNGLNDDNESIFLYDLTKTLIADFSWNVNIKSSGNSFSFVNGTWQQCEPTPASINCQNQANMTTNITSLSKIIINYPEAVYNNGTEFLINLTFLNFDSGVYNLKVSLTDLEGKEIAEIWNATDWKSSFYWIKPAFTLNTSNFSYSLRARIMDNYEGNSSLKIKLNHTNTSKIYESEPSSITIIKGVYKNEEEEEELELSLSEEINCSINFTVEVKTKNFADGLYDVKIDILGDGQRVGKVWNGSKWLSTFSYVKKVLEVKNGEGRASLIFKIENFSGEIMLMPKLRKTGTSTTFNFDEVYAIVICEEKNRVRSETSKESIDKFKTKESNFYSFSDFDLSFNVSLRDNIVIVDGKIKNKTKIDELYVWSYVEDIKGNCLSCKTSKEENVEAIKFQDSEQRFTLIDEIFLSDIAESLAILKINILSKQQVEQHIEIKSLLNLNIQQKEKIQEQEQKVLYDKSKLKDYSIYLLIIAIFFLIILIIFKKEL